MLSALASLLPAPIKRLFESAGGGNGGSGGDVGGGGDSGSSRGGRRQRRRSSGNSGQGGPVLQEARSAFTGAAQGGTQGLGWYSRSMVSSKEEDGDMAHGFIYADEVEAAQAVTAGGGGQAATPAAAGEAGGGAAGAAAAAGGKGR
jgi:hypothetical protein